MVVRLDYEFLPDEVAQGYCAGASPVIEEAPELEYFGSPEDLTHSLHIGDNLDSMMSLALTKAGTFNVIYADPPYNTGSSSFTYSDRHHGRGEDRHSRWLSFMAPRLRLARELLAPTGVIIMAIGPQELHHLRCLMDEVFGEGNFISQVTWSAGILNLARYVSNTSDYMLFYARDIRALGRTGVKWREPKPNFHRLQDKAYELMELHGGDAEAATKEFRAWLRTQDVASSEKYYNTIEADTGRASKATDVSSPARSGTPRTRLYTGASISSPVHHSKLDNLNYDLLHPVTGKPCAMPSSGWCFIKATMERKVAEGRIIFGPDHTTQPSVKTYLDEVSTQVPRDVFYQDRGAASRHVQDILGRWAFSHPKDHRVIARWLDMVAPADANVLDLFAGSGSTLEAALELNSKDGGTRKVTLLTTDEDGIATKVTRERAVRVISGEGWANPKRARALGGNLAVYRTSQSMEPKHDVPALSELRSLVGPSTYLNLRAA